MPFYRNAYCGFWYKFVANPTPRLICFCILPTKCVATRNFGRKRLPVFSAIIYTTFIFWRWLRWTSCSLSPFWNSIIVQCKCCLGSKYISSCVPVLNIIVRKTNACGFFLKCLLCFWTFGLCINRFFKLNFPIFNCALLTCIITGYKF